jgi:hypothetical protein
MDHDKERHETASQHGEDASLLKRLAAFHHFMRECRACQQELEPHWQFCAHCGVRVATPCPGCGNPLPPAGAPACPSCGLAIPQGGA